MTTLKDNLRARFDNVKSTAKKEVDIAKGSVRKLTELRPVPAVTNLVADTVGNVRDFVNTQAGITRRWIE